MTDVFHYTDGAGFDAIRSQRDWHFQPNQPKAANQPVGAYFTNLCPSEANLPLICKKLRVPRPKRDFVFWFVGIEGLKNLSGGRGEYILYSEVEYIVRHERQRFHGRPEEVKAEFA